MLGDPFQPHRPLLPEPRGQPHFPRIPFARLVQGGFAPLQTPHLLLEQTQRRRLLRLPPFGSIMGGPQPPRRGRQQFLPELLAAQAPTPLDRLEFFGQVFPPPLLGQSRKFPSPSRAVFGDALFPKQPVHPQPVRALARWFEVVSAAAP